MCCSNGFLAWGRRGWGVKNRSKCNEGVLSWIQTITRALNLHHFISHDIHQDSEYHLRAELDHSNFHSQNHCYKQLADFQQKWFPQSVYLLMGGWNASSQNSVWSGHFSWGASLIVKKFFSTWILCNPAIATNAGITRVDCSNCRPASIAAFRYVRYAAIRAMPPRCCIFCDIYHQQGTRFVIYEIKLDAEELLLHVDCRKWK